MNKGILMKNKTVVGDFMVNFKIKDDTNMDDFKDGQEVNFEIVSVYVEPDDSIHCNRGCDVQVAIILTDDDVWNKIKSNLYVGSRPEDDSIDCVIDMLREKGYKIIK